MHHLTTKSGVILCNLGTPSEATAKGVRNFLAPFLSDQRVVELPRILWMPILYGIVLPLRSKRVAKAYQEIWWPEGSPLKVITERQCDKLRQRLVDSDVLVEYSLSYSDPRLDATIDSMRARGVENILLLPLYPQYSATTTASIYDQLSAYTAKQRNLPSVQIIRDYHDHPAYISALANSIKTHRANGPAGEHLLFSFHGIPEVNVKKGDPYSQQCEVTANLVAQALGLSESQWSLCYQSRFGKQEWLKPYTTQTLLDFGKRGVSIDIICPAFAADCLETLEEISQENRDDYLEAGGTQFRYVPCLNDSEDHIDLFFSLIANSFLKI